MIVLNIERLVDHLVSVQEEEHVSEEHVPFYKSRFVGFVH